MPESIAECPICGGTITRAGDEICCKEEDSYLLIRCKGQLRTSKDRAASIEDLAWKMYDCLAEFLQEHDEDISNYDEEMVYKELQRRILRWINKEMIPVSRVQGIGFCSMCGMAMLAGRTKCSSCAESGAIGSLGSMSSPGMPAAKRSGMHLRR